MTITKSALESKKINFEGKANLSIPDCKFALFEETKGKRGFLNFWSLYFNLLVKIRLKTFTFESCISTTKTRPQAEGRKSARTKVRKVRF